MMGLDIIYGRRELKASGLDPINESAISHQDESPISRANREVSKISYPQTSNSKFANNYYKPVQKTAGRNYSNRLSFEDK